MQKASPKAIHFLGLTQIFSYGLLYYVFAILKEPLAQHVAVSPDTILKAISALLFIQAILSYLIGQFVDRIGGLRVLGTGLLLGSIGIGALWIVPSFWWVCLCLGIIGISFSLATYEVAFSIAVQLDERRSRHLISVISFYGGVASTVVWLIFSPILSHFGLITACLSAAAILASLGSIALYLSGSVQPLHARLATQTDFSFGLLSKIEKNALLLIAGSNAIYYMAFSAVTLLWISWFSSSLGNMTLAVILASLFGPFQVVGRVIEMRFAHKIDARITGIIAFCLIICGILLAMIPHPALAVISMILYGIGNGIITIMFGFVTNLYFSANVYGRAKGLITIPRGFGMALGPFLGSVFYGLYDGLFLPIIAGFVVMALLQFALLLRLPVANNVHQNKT
ncbi:MAG: MFS transporter [Candidatus Puniceispirillaceae bacterium]